MNFWNVILLGLSRPCANRGQIEPRSVFLVATDSCEISSRSGFGKMVIIEHGDASAWAGLSKIYIAYMTTGVIVCERKQKDDIIQFTY